MGSETMANPKDTGDETEAKAIHELIACGYSVSIPFGDNDPYDLIVDDRELYRVQCKTAWRNKENTIRFNTHSQTTANGAYHENTYQDEIDAFLVRHPGNETLYWIDIDEATEQKMELRFTAEIEHPSILSVVSLCATGGQIVHKNFSLTVYQLGKRLRVPWGDRIVITISRSAHHGGSVLKREDSIGTGGVDRKS
jgi:hypothetical protein